MVAPSACSEKHCKKLHVTDIRTTDRNNGTPTGTEADDQDMMTQIAIDTGMMSNHRKTTGTDEDIKDKTDEMDTDVQLMNDSMMIKMVAGKDRMIKDSRTTGTGRDTQTMTDFGHTTIEMYRDIKPKDNDTAIQRMAEPRRFHRVIHTKK